MGLDDVTLQATDEADARRKASRMLDTAPENVVLQPLAENQWRAMLRDRNAAIEITISSDELGATVASYAPPLGSGQPLSAAQVEQCAREAGVTVELDAGSVATVIDRIQSDQDPTGLVVARGEEGSPGEPGMCKALGNLNAPVAPGDVFARLLPPKEPQPTRTVTGKEELPPGSDKAKPVEPVLKEGCRLAESGDGICADLYGLASVAGDRATVDPLTTVSADRMAFYATLYAYTFDGRECSMDLLRQILEGAGVTAELETEPLGPIFEALQDTGEVQEDVLLCRGTPPQDGEDGRLERYVQTVQAVGTLQEDGRMDFRERGTVHNVEAGTLLARLIPPTDGIPGQDVFGTPVPAADGEPASVTAGENVAVSADGAEFRATVDGMVLYVGGTLSVTDVFAVPGDVDLSTGNIHTDKGSVQIGGTVHGSFAVTSKGNVVVQQTVEDATLDAAGDVTVGGGIVMHAEGSVHAGGTVAARFAQNARIEAGGDVIVEHHLTNCEVLAKGRIVAVQGKGRIQGGSLRCGRGLEANELGSDLGVETEVIVGLATQEHAETVAERRRLEETVRKIDIALGTGDPRTILERTPRPKRCGVAALLKARLAARDRIAHIDGLLAAEWEERKAQAQARVRVNQTAHPGVSVTIAGCRLDVTRELHACEFYYDAEEDEVRMRPV